MPTPRENGRDAPHEASAIADRVALSPLDDDAGFLLARASAVALGEGNRSLAEHGLRVRSYSVLALAASDGGPTQRELAAVLRLDPSQVVTLVDELEGRGLVERRPAESDRRANVVAATAEGRALLLRASVSASDAERRIVSVLSEREQAQFTALLRRVALRLP